MPTEPSVMKSKLWIQVSNHPDYENLIAEVWQGDLMVADLCKIDGTYRLRLFDSEGPDFSLDCDEFIAKLQRARTMV